MTVQPPKKSPSEVWAATSPADRRKALVTGLVLVVLVLGFVVYAFRPSSGGGSTTPSGLDTAGCMALYEARVGHDPGDNAFWQGLVECANNGLLPAGQNDPGFYSH